MKPNFRIFLFLALFCRHAYCQQINVDSLKYALPGVKSDTIRLSVLSDLCFGYVNSVADTAMQYAILEIKLAEKIATPKYKATAFNDLALVQYYQGDYTNALINNKKALALRQQAGNAEAILSSHNKIAVIYQEMAEYEKATEMQLEALRLAEQLRNEAYIGATVNNLATLLLKVKKYDESLRYGQRALSIATAGNDTLQMAVAYAAIEGVYEQTYRFDSASAFQAKVIALLERTNALVELSHAYNDMGYLARIRKKDAEGIYYYRKALLLAAQAGNTTDEAFYAANLGSAYLAQRKQDSAYVFLQKAMILNRESSRPEVLKIIYGGLESYYILANNHDSALHYSELYKEISDTIYSAVTARQVNELLTKYETKQKEQQILLLNKQNTIKELVIGHRNMAIASIAAAFAIVVLIGIMYYYRYRSTQESKLQHELMVQQHLTSKAVIAAEELERKRIAGDLHDGIGQMFSAVKMNLSGIADRIEIGDEDRLLLDKTLALVDESCKEVRVISHQMMPNVLLKSGLAAAIRDFIDKIDESRLKITLETFGLNQPLDSSVETVLYRVIQESVNNVIRHANATRLDIQLHRDDESISVTIEDNGTGFDISAIPADKGIGLKSIKARVAFLDGKVDYDTSPGKGTLVAIFIPNKQQ